MPEGVGFWAGFWAPAVAFVVATVGYRVFDLTGYRLMVLAVFFGAATAGAGLKASGARPVVAVLLALGSAALTVALYFLWLHVASGGLG